MATVTDLTWTQLNTALNQLLGSNANAILMDGETDAPATISIQTIAQNTEFTGNTTAGVIKFITRLYDACRLAQETVNQGKATGERLTAFGAATAATPRGALVPISRTMITQADLSSATKIVGTNA